MQCPINGNKVDVPCDVHYCPFNVQGCKYKDNIDDSDIAKILNINKKEVIKLREDGLKQIETLIIVDKYYDFLTSEYTAKSNENVYTQLVLDNSFPFNFPKHKWTKFLLKKAFLKKNWNKFCRTMNIQHDISILGDKQ